MSNVSDKSFIYRSYPKLAYGSIYDFLAGTNFPKSPHVQGFLKFATQISIQFKNLICQCKLSGKIIGQNITLLHSCYWHCRWEFQFDQTEMKREESSFIIVLNVEKLKYNLEM